jgi:predicted MFS family arabinose efflux permease
MDFAQHYTNARCGDQVSPMRVPKSKMPFFGMLAQSGLARFANQMSAVVYGWGMLQETGSSFASGLILASSLAALTVGTLFAGRLIARFGSRQVVLWGNWVSFAAALAIAFCFTAGVANPMFVAFIAALGAILDGPAGIASETNYPKIARIGRVDLMRLNAFDDGLDHVATLIAPACGAAVIALVSVTGATWVLAVLGFLAAGMVIVALPAFKHTTEVANASLRMAYDHLMSDTLLLRLTVLFCAVIAIFASVEFMILPRAIKDAGLEAATLASVLFGIGIGGIGGALLAAPVSRILQLSLLVALVFALLAASVTVMAVADTPTAFVTSGVLAGLGSGLISAPVNTLLQTRPPSNVRADVQSLIGALSVAATPAALLLSAWLADVVPIKIIVIVSAFCLMALSLLAAFWLANANSTEPAES